MLEKRIWESSCQRLGGTQNAGQDHGTITIHFCNHDIKMKIKQNNVNEYIIIKYRYLASRSHPLSGTRMKG